MSLLLLLLCAAAHAAETTVAGRVVGITDGDTLTLLTAGNTQVRVRLTEIDTPERGQPWGTQARQVLSDKVVAVHTEGTDRYGRRAEMRNG